MRNICILGGFFVILMQSFTDVVRTTTSKTFYYPEISTLQFIFHSLLMVKKLKMLQQTFLLELMVSPIG